MFLKIIQMISHIHRYLFNLLNENRGKSWGPFCFRWRRRIVVAIFASFLITFYGVFRFFEQSSFRIVRTQCCSTNMEVIKLFRRFSVYASMIYIPRTVVRHAKVLLLESHVFFARSGDWQKISQNEKGRRNRKENSHFTFHCGLFSFNVQTRKSWHANSSAKLPKRLKEWENWRKITYADATCPLIFASNFYIDRLVFPWVASVPKSCSRVLVRCWLKKVQIISWERVFFFFVDLIWILSESSWINYWRHGHFKLVRWLFSFKFQSVCLKKF